MALTDAIANHVATRKALSTGVQLGKQLGCVLAKALLPANSDNGFTSEAGRTAAVDGTPTAEDGLSVVAFEAAACLEAEGMDDPEARCSPPFDRTMNSATPAEWAEALPLLTEPCTSERIPFIATHLLCYLEASLLVSMYILIACLSRVSTFLPISSFVWFVVSAGHLLWVRDC
jgi:hypothetical protein